MKNKKLKIICMVLFCGACLYLLKNWQNYNEKSTFEVENVEFSQTKLNIESLKTMFKEPVWFVKSESPLVCFNIIFKNEGERSFYKSPGILDILIPALLEGAGTRDEIVLKNILDENSINISISNTLDDIVISVSCLAKYFNLATDLVSDILSKAHLKQEKLEITKQGITVAIQQDSFNPSCISDERLNNLIFAENHPYRFSMKETLKAIKTYQKPDIDKCYASIFDPRNASITLCGKLEKLSVISCLNKIYKSISHKKNDFQNVEQKTDLNFSGKPEHLEFDNPQSSVRFALPGISKTSCEKFAVKFANMVFGNPGFNSRLLKNIRDKKGLVYRINSKIKNLDLQSSIQGVADTRPENLEKVIKSVKEECKNFYENGITEEELKLFKTYIFANNILDSAIETLNFVETCRLDNIALEDINTYLNNYYRLSIEEVNSAIKKIFNPTKLILVDCGKSTQKTEVKNEKIK